MNIINSEIYNQIKEVHKFPMGDLFFFENMIIAQVNEGEHVSFDSTKIAFKCIYDYYEAFKKPFGIISNRLNKYSIEVLDLPKYSKNLPNLKLYGVVGYTNFNDINISLEKQFSKIPVLDFDNITKAYDTINDYILNSTDDSVTFDIP
ncbi:hypothetical protein [Olleya sp. UBA1516]|uniref:hypothetical protein n=1 Tax=Olleya sp. UBA1516 TaxID=1947013 RepID=UPI0025D87EAE|nr:hypothetical protein [Olleya sp. UBA1516]|tara:strand:- start:4141 stop:4584 length:444 start_codon:yes stop_codon:yes gene_type:complete